MKHLTIFIALLWFISAGVITWILILKDYFIEAVFVLPLYIIVGVLYSILDELEKNRSHSTQTKSI